MGPWQSLRKTLKHLSPPWWQGGTFGRNDSAMIKTNVKKTEKLKWYRFLKCIFWYRFPRKLLTCYITLPVETTATSWFLQAGPGSSKADFCRCWHRFGIVFCFANQSFFWERHTHAKQYWPYSKSTNLVILVLHTVYFIIGLETAASNSSRRTCKSTETGIVFHVHIFCAGVAYWEQFASPAKRNHRSV